MEGRPSWAPENVDVDRPNAARMYDYFLGGFHNFAADRELADQVIASWPHFPMVARANRAFLRRAVTYLAEQGVDQYLDIGSGVPTVGNVHEIAQAIRPQSRVVYVDLEPVAVTHSRQMLADNPHATAVLADLRRPQDILAHPDVTRLLDFSRPVALLLVAVLHFVVEDEVPPVVTKQFRDAFRGGSWLVLSHGASDFASDDFAEEIGSLYRRSTTPAVGRTKEQVSALFDGYRVVDPGIVLVEQWQPGSVAPVEEPERCPVWVGVGRTS